MISFIYLSLVHNTQVTYTGKIPFVLNPFFIHACEFMNQRLRAEFKRVPRGYSTEAASRGTKCKVGTWCKHSQRQTRLGPVF